jgi:glucose/arabinose dehydrogenase
MKTRSVRRLLAACAAAAVSVAAVPAADAQVLDTLRIASALEWPLYVTHAPGEPYHIYIVLKRGRIIRHDLRDNTQTTFIDLDPVVVNPSGVNDERGLLGLAFDPNYATNGRFYVNYYSNSATTVIARYTASGGVGNPASAVTLLSFSQPFTNHNGGWMGFGPDGFLYIASGDGGSSGDPGDRGQNINNILGKMLRIDVNGTNGSTGNYGNPASNPFAGATPGLDEIWAYGLRNPWRSSFDRLTGAFYIADVGQNAWEEINFQAAGAAGGQNYGWRCYEGNVVFNNTGLCNPLPAGVVFPFHVYGRLLGVSITGGYVYRGCAIPAVYGEYFFGDFGTARVWSFAGASASAPPAGGLTDRSLDLSPPIGGGSISAIASFGEDAFGEMYIVRHSTTAGEVFRIVPQGNAITDCNGNNISDCGEIALGLVPDCNNNGVIDSCEIAADPSLDCDSNGVIDSCEIAADPSLDCDNNGVLDACQIAANPLLDCNGNAVLDSCELAADPSLDCNSDGLLDACQMCLGDANNDGVVNFTDLTDVLANFGNAYFPCLVGPGDASKDGFVNFNDVTTVLGAFGTICP